MSGDFRFEYRPGTIRYGSGSVAHLGSELANAGGKRALVVTGETVGQTAAVMDPVREGLGDRLAGVFAKTSPDKRIETALAAARRVAETDADAIVGVGGGSSLDLATVTAVVAAREDPAEAARELVESGGIAVPAEGVLPVLSVPTTLAGADLSGVAGVTAGPETVEAYGDQDDTGVVHGGVGDPRLMPRALCYDPELFRTTPEGVLLASAMNGFDKAVETPYARTGTPVTDATSVRALSLLREGLPALGDGNRDDETMHKSIVGTVLAQYGVSRPDALTLSLIHAFGHALARPYDLQQGVAHGLVAPHALAYLFESVDGRRHLLAEGLGVEGSDDETVAAGVVDAVAGVRDGLGLPSRIRDVDGPGREDLPAVARATLEDSFLANAPEGLDPTVEGLTGVLESAW